VIFLFHTLHWHVIGTVNRIKSVHLQTAKSFLCNQTPALCWLLVLPSGTISVDRLWLHLILQSFMSLEDIWKFLVCKLSLLSLHGLLAVF